MSPRRTLPGITTLIRHPEKYLHGTRIALVAHQASINEKGEGSADLINALPGYTLQSILGPEHGFIGSATAGQAVSGIRHPRLGIPVYSLYGTTRKPTPNMLKNTDTVVFDLQDIPARPYTYVSTLLLLMESLTSRDIRLVVADRPVPLPCTVDGPIRSENTDSFVAAVDMPMAYGLTSGEAALWLKKQLSMDIDLLVAPASCWRRRASADIRTPWTPPSPGIKSWHSAETYLSTLFSEAIPVIDNGRGTPFSFQTVAAPWLNAQELKAELDVHRMPGASFRLCDYRAAIAPYEGRLLSGIRIFVDDPNRFKPVSTSIHILHAINAIAGKKIWTHRTTRAEFFDTLYASKEIRIMLRDGLPPHEIEGIWQRDLVAFQKTRKPILLYS